ncbi:MAG TPA: hypothetical protein VEC99_18365 [Clostridia bacterium]|nr:hypothetical protein [Clostridia bacterium]
MKNGDLIVRGERVDQLDLTRFTAAKEMTYWELGQTGVLGVYEAYDALHGEGTCERERLDTLTDLFGAEFSDAFFKQKNKLIARAYLKTAREELADVERRIRQLEHMEATGERIKSE